MTLGLDARATPNAQPGTVKMVSAVQLVSSAAVPTANAYPGKSAKQVHSGLYGTLSIPVFH
jgi:hypothetical protein